MKIKISAASSLFISILVTTGCARAIKYTVIRTMPDIAIVESKGIYVAEIPEFGGPSREDPYLYNGETPLLKKWSFPDPETSLMMGTFYIQIRISKPGYYPVERRYLAVDIPDTIELELEKVK